MQEKGYKMKKSYNGLFLGLGLLTALIATVLVTTGGVFSKGFLIRATSTTIEDGTITFNGANTTRSSYTYTTPSKTAGGNYIKAVGTDNGLNENGVVAYFAYEDSELHFRDSSNNEFNFTSSILKSISLTKSEWGTFSIKYAYKQTGDSEFTISDSIDAVQAKAHIIDLGNLEDVSEFKSINASTNTGKFSKVIITYDCGPGVNRTLSDLEITTSPTKTTYYDGESFSSTGMVITATYSNGDTANVTSTCTFDKTTLTTTDTKVTASYTYKDTTLTVEQSISVDPITVTSVSLDEDELELEVGQSATLTATVLPSNATDKTISWSTSNSSIATVDGGVVTAVIEGEATITATTNDGGYTASCHVTVTDSGELRIVGTYNYTSRSKYSTPNWSLHNMTIDFYSDGTCMWRNQRTNTLGNVFDCKVYFTYVATDTGSNITLAMPLTGYDFTKDGKYDNQASSFSGGSYDRPIDGGFGSSTSKNNSGVLSSDRSTLTINVYDQSHSYEVYDTFTFTLAQ